MKRSNMKRSLQTSLLKGVNDSTERLQRSIDMHSYLLTSGHELSDYSSSKLPPTKLSSTHSHDLSQSLVEAEVGNDGQQPNNLNAAPQSALLAQAESYHESMKKLQRRLHSWPPREVADYGEDGGIGMDLIPRMRAYESTAALSLATFTSLLIEFVARLDHLVDAVDELAKLAKFKHEGIIK